MFKITLLSRSNISLRNAFGSLLIYSSLLVNSSCAPKVSPNVSMSPFDFRVDQLNQYATLYCPAPQTSLETQTRPIVLLLHGGFDGDDSATHSLGQRLAERGFCALAPTYRGEKRNMDGQRSDGKIEFCLGEVKDVMTLIDQVKQYPKLSGQQFSLVGFSHGGCIALRVAQQRSDIRSVVVFSGPVDAAATYENVSKNWEKNIFFNGLLASALRDYVGATPEENLDAWNQRSPLLYMQNFHSSLLFIHGLSDNIVPVEQTFRLRDQLKADGKTLVEKKFSEQNELLQEQVSPNTLTVADALKTTPSHEFMFFEEQGHTYSKSAHEFTENYVVNFLLKQHSLPSTQETKSSR